MGAGGISGDQSRPIYTTHSFLSVVFELRCLGRVEDGGYSENEGEQNLLPQNV